MCKQVQRMKPNEKKKNTESQKSAFLFPFCSLKTEVISYSIDLHCIVNQNPVFTRFVSENSSALSMSLLHGFLPRYVSLSQLYQYLYPETYFRSDRIGNMFVMTNFHY